jgi:hypothetical protein
VLVNAVRLLEREGNVLWVSGLEAVDGTPLVDIKPYVPLYFKVEDPCLPDWMKRIIRELAEGRVRATETPRLNAEESVGFDMQRRPPGTSGLDHRAAGISQGSDGAASSKISRRFNVSQ